MSGSTTHPFDLKEIYKSRAADYERLVGREDYLGNIPKTLPEIRDPQGLDVVELGAGTGRLTCLLAPVARSIQAFDASAHMLGIARSKLQAGGWANWRLGVGEHRALPVQDGCADLVISGWSLVYSVLWAQGDWRLELGQVMREILRVMRPGGTVILLETMGTGFETPHPPAGLLDYFATLDQDGFQSTWIRTDYYFESLPEARELASFFFGEEMTARIQVTDRVILPECTGLWWKTV